MLKLIIEQHGLFIDLTDLAPFRSPAEIDITRKNVNRIINELRSLGIEDFVIESKPGIKRKTEPEKIEKQPNVVVDFNELKDTINELMKEVKNKQPEKTVVVEKHIIENNNLKNKKIDDIEEEDSFIPSIDTSGMSVKGKQKYKTKKGSNDINESVEKLRKFGKKKSKEEE